MRPIWQKRVAFSLFFFARPSPGPRAALPRAARPKKSVLLTPPWKMPLVVPLRAIADEPALPGLVPMAPVTPPPPPEAAFVLPRGARSAPTAGCRVVRPPNAWCGGGCTGTFCGVAPAPYRALVLFTVAPASVHVVYFCLHGPLVYHYCSIDGLWAKQ